LLKFALQPAFEPGSLISIAAMLDFIIHLMCFSFYWYAAASYLIISAPVSRLVSTDERQDNGWLSLHPSLALMQPLLHIPITSTLQFLYAFPVYPYILYVIK